MRLPTSSTRALLAAFAVLGLSSLSSAQTVSVKTKPVGAVTKTIPVGLTALGINLLNPALLQGNVTANTSSVVTISGVANVGALLTSGLPYYIEGVSGSLEGDRFDVDTAATIAAANGTVVLTTSSANNTLALTSNAAVGSSFVLRKHVTLAQIQASFSTPLVGNTTPNLADQIWLLNSAGTSFNVYYLRADLVNWRLSGNPTNVPNLAVPPGVGIVFKKVNAVATLTHTGEVRTNGFAMPLPVGLSFKAPPYPVSYSPATLGGTLANGWTGNTTPGLADQLQVLNPAGTSFNVYYMRADGVSWRLSGNPTNVQTNLLFSYDSAYLVARKTADVNYFLASPVSL